MQKDLFCGRCNQQTSHTLTVQGKEFVATCDTGCTGFVKFTASTKEQLLSEIETYNTVNQPVVTAEMESAETDALQAILNSL